MPMHDWTRVSAGTYHDFHCSWLADLKNRLNAGLLPDESYAQIEQVGRLNRRLVAIRHERNEQLLAALELISPEDKADDRVWAIFVARLLIALRRGVHLLIVDLFPPSGCDPQGIHGAIWSELGGDHLPPSEKPLTLVAYTGGELKTAYVEPIAVGDVLTAMPLFLQADRYIPLPLEESYAATFLGVPRRYREDLER
jgi:hypothetical protein